ncbi:hypothetical protein [Bacillus thuringiensis]|uniref:hypothetical protein n=1 Tax=Bacillus thuringiensis TaxID=1428 RepID=UPI00159BA6C6|nr:hypothetical protein [Bacillus thuringiensis]
MNKICLNCGSREIGQGSLDAQVYLRPISINNFFNQFSRVIIDICTECGTVLSMESEH